MTTPQHSTALIVGAGAGLSASLARIFARGGHARGAGGAQCRQAGRAGARDRRASLRLRRQQAPSQVAKLFDDVDARHRRRPTSWSTTPAPARAGRSSSSSPADVERAIAVSAFGGFLVAQQAAKRMLPKGHGAILLTGASASVKGYANSAPFAMGKFALRGLAQSMARELAPQGIHVAHFVIDGGIRSAGAPRSGRASPTRCSTPTPSPQSYLHVLRQPRSAWTWEIELRPWVENF